MDWKRYITTRFWTRSPTASDPVLVSAPEARPPEPEALEAGLAPLTLWLERTPNEGEDALPVAAQLSEDPTAMLLGVFDGLGGAGGTVATLDNGESHSHAYLASRLVRQACLDYFTEGVPHPDGDIPALVKGLKIQLDNALQVGVAGTAQQGFKLRGTLVQQLPTTLALAYARTNGEGVAETLVVWAGDSRVYQLSPTVGLVQLTVDDLQTPGDAFDNLTNDSPMSNYASATRPFRLNYRVVEIAAPCLLLAATDGCFDYLPTPMHWEYLLLRSLVRVNTVAEWGRELERRLAEVAGDDVSLALFGLGFDSLGDLKLIMARRFAAVKRDYILPLHDALADSQETRRRQRALARTLWAEYKMRYEWDDPLIRQEA